MTAKQDETIKVLLADDHTIVREGVRALLAREGDISIVGEAADGNEAVQMTQKLEPDVVVMDLAMPRLNGVDAAVQIRKYCPNTRVLILSMYQTEEYVRPAIRAGVNGYLLKGSGISDLVAATRAVAAGEAFFSPAVASIVLRDALGDRPTGEGEELSTREREVLQLVAEGKSSPQIAGLLSISVKTVEGHRSHIMAKLNIRDLAGLVRYAVRVGLVSSDS